MKKTLVLLLLVLFSSILSMDALAVGDFVAKKGNTSWGVAERVCGNGAQWKALGLPSRLVAEVKYAVDPSRCQRSVNVSVARTSVKPLQSARRITHCGACEYRHPNADPFCKKGDNMYTLTQQYGFTVDEAKYILANIDTKGVRYLVPFNGKMSRLSFGSSNLLEGVIRNRVKKPLYVTKLALPNGKVIYRRAACCNWLQLSVNDTLPRPIEITVPQYGYVSIPEPAPAVEKPLVKGTAVAEADEGLSDMFSDQPIIEEETTFCSVLDPKLVLGQEHEPKHDDASMVSNYLAAALYCTWRGEEGTHGIGIGGLTTRSHGQANAEGGRWKSRVDMIGPKYEYVADRGWDVSVGAYRGSLRQQYSQGGYSTVSKTRYDFLGFDWNDYRRRVDGKNVLPEMQYTLLSGWPRGSEGASYLSIGARAWLYEDADMKVLPYVQASLFEMDPSKSGSLRLGVSDPNRIVGVGVGFDHDFKSGGNVKAWGWWFDPIAGVRTWIEHNRNKEALASLANDGVTFDESTGMLVISSAPSSSDQAEGRKASVSARSDAGAGWDVMRGLDQQIETTSANQSVPDRSESVGGGFNLLEGTL